MREVELMDGESQAAEAGATDSKGSDQAPLLAPPPPPPPPPPPSPPSCNAPPSSGGAPVVKDDNVLHDPKYAAYARDDNFGTLGRGSLHWSQRAMLFLAMLTIAPLRFVLLLLVLLAYYIICRIFTLLRSPSDEEGQENYEYLRGTRRLIIVYSGRFLARVMFFVLGFYWIKVKHIDGAEEVADDESFSVAPGAIVSNHVSYLDILYHMSASFPSFVAKRSVAKLPLIGLISKCLGCIYVQRESKTSDTKGVSGIVTERLRAAHSEEAQAMLLFPEGTTTNGKHLLPFKTGAFLSQAPVQPVVLKYPYWSFSPAWESISGVRHILLLLCQPVNFLEVTRLPVYVPSEKEKADPRVYAANVRAFMAAAGGLTLSDIGLPEKRVYLDSLRSSSM